MSLNRFNLAAANPAALNASSTAANIKPVLIFFFTFLFPFPSGRPASAS